NSFNNPEKCLCGRWRIAHSHIPRISLRRLAGIRRLNVQRVQRAGFVYEDEGVVAVWDDCGDVVAVVLVIGVVDDADGSMAYRLAQLGPACFGSEDYEL